MNLRKKLAGINLSHSDIALGRFVFLSSVKQQGSELYCEPYPDSLMFSYLFSVLEKEKVRVQSKGN